jgi:hypothetical protein
VRRSTRTLTRSQAAQQLTTTEAKKKKTFFVRCCCLLENRAKVVKTRFAQTDRRDLRLTDS